MEGVRRNIALKLKPAVGKESGPRPGDGGKKKEGEEIGQMRPVVSHVTLLQGASLQVLWKR